MTSPVMDAGDGVYIVNAHASSTRGPPQGFAYDAANKYCAEREPGSHAVVMASSATLAVGGRNAQAVEVKPLDPTNAEIRFRCVE